MSLLKPCPFCEGPPVAFVGCAKGGWVRRAESFGDEGVTVSAHVFCHECGARGPRHDDFIFDGWDWDSVKQKAIDLWQGRDNRHRELYDRSPVERLLDKQEISNEQK